MNAIRRARLEDRAAMWTRFVATVISHAGALAPLERLRRLGDWLPRGAISRRSRSPSRQWLPSLAGTTGARLRPMPAAIPVRERVHDPIRRPIRYRH